MIGGSLFYDFARGGATPAPFQSFVLSAGVVTDYVYGAGMHWQGGCGGFPCDGSGSLNQWNVIGELKAATPLGGGNTLNGYIGAGTAILWPSGHPTGGTTSFQGARPRQPCALGGMDHQFDQYWSAGFKVGIQHTGSAEFETTSERFRFPRRLPLDTSIECVSLLNPRILSNDLRNRRNF